MAGRLPCKPRQQIFLLWDQGLVFLMTFLDAELSENAQYIDHELFYLFNLHECVFKSLRFHFTENAMKVLRPHDSFQIVLPVHTKTIKATESAFNLPLRMCRRRYLSL